MYRLFPLLFLFFLFSCDGSREHSGNDKSGGLNDTGLTETGRLEVMFDSSGRMGTQKKSVTVVSNAETQTSKLMIIAEVVAGQ